MPAYRRAVRQAVWKAALAASVACLSMTSALAQQQFDRLVSFGDSYADPGVNLIPLLLGNTNALPTEGKSVEDVAEGYPWVAFPYWLQDGLGLANEDMTSYAIGGSTTTEMNQVGIPYSLPYQMEQSADETYGEDTLVSISIGGNDGRRDANTYGADFTPVLATQLAGGVADRAADAINTFVDQGAGTVLVASFSDLSLLPEQSVHPRQDGLRAYGGAMFNGMQQNLVATAEAGARIFLIDITSVGSQIKADPAAYGFETFAYAGDAETSVFGPDGLHLTDNGFRVMADYMLNVLQAPYAVAGTPTLAEASARSFTTSLMNRLDSRRFGEATAPYSVYVMGGFTGSDNDATGIDGDGGRGTIGAEMNFNAKLLGGVAVSYSSLDSSSALADVENKALQVSAYASWKQGGWFADGLLGYGSHDLDLTRPGVISPVSGSADGDTVSASVQGGYLFDLGGVKAGPLLGLRHTRTRIDAYDETGDAGLAMLVERQSLSSTTSDLGVTVHAPLGRETVNAFASVAWRHEFGDEYRTLTTRLAQSPLLPIGTEIRNFDGWDYGVVSGGLSFDLTQNMSATVAGSATFARNSGNSFQIDAGLGISF